MRTGERTLLVGVILTCMVTMVPSLVLVVLFTWR